MKDNIQKALECQLNLEFASAYMYLGFSSWFSDQSLNGFANWMRVQAQEEMAHAMHIYDYLIEASAKVQLAALDEATPNIQSSLDAFKQSLAHEQKITQSIDSIVELTLQEKDYASHEFMLWYLREQVEEESNARYFVDRLNLIAADVPSLLQLDAEVATRVYTDPFQAQGN